MMQERLLKIVIKVNFIIILFVLLNVCGFADDFNPVQIDYCNFMASENSKTGLEVYAQFSNLNMQYVKYDSTYIAEVEVVAAIEDKKGDLVDEISNQQEFEETDYVRTIDGTVNKLVQLNFILEPGNYVLRLFFKDMNTDKTFEVKRKISVRSFDHNRLSISDIQLATSIEPSNENCSFVKAGRKILSNPCRIFLANQQPVRCYFEVYNLNFNEHNKSNSLKFSYVVRNEEDEVVQKFSTIYRKPYTDTALDFFIPTENLKTGAYNIEVKIWDEDDNKSVVRDTEFHFVQTLCDLNCEDYDNFLSMVQLIASRKEMKKLKNTPANEREIAVAKFWESKDPTPATPTNEFMIEFYERIAIANKEFADPGHEGWKSDRGRIFIKYGMPDKIVALEPLQSFKKLEKWEYYNKNKSFVFIDNHGFGDYKLLSYGND